MVLEIYIFWIGIVFHDTSLNKETSCLTGLDSIVVRLFTFFCLPVRACLYEASQPALPRWSLRCVYMEARQPSKASQTTIFVVFIWEIQCIFISVNRAGVFIWDFSIPPCRDLCIFNRDLGKAGWKNSI